MFFLLINIINQSLNSTPIFVHPFFLLGTNPKVVYLYLSENLWDGGESQNDGQTCRCILNAHIGISIRVLTRPPGARLSFDKMKKCTTPLARPFFCMQEPTLAVT